MKIKFESFNAGKETKILCTFGAIKKLYEDIPELTEGKEMSSIRNMEYLITAIYYFIQSENKPDIETFKNAFSSSDIRLAADVVPAAINGFTTLEEYREFIDKASEEAKKN